MAKDLNKCMATGRLGADPEARYTPGGSLVVTFRMASNRSYRTADGEQHEETEWFRVVVWEGLGQVANNHLRKGSRVFVEGRIQTRQWQDQNGQTRYMTELIAQDLILLDGRRDADGDEIFDEDEADELPTYDTGGAREQADPSVAPADAPTVRAQTPPPPAPAGPPRTPGEAEQRFYARYGEIVNGQEWLSVQRYLNTRSPRPTTVDGWLAAAQAVRDKHDRESWPAESFDPPVRTVAAAERAHHSPNARNRPQRVSPGEMAALSDAPPTPPAPGEGGFRRRPGR